MGNETRGFASMSAEERRENARRGGLKAHAMGRRHSFTPEEARLAGKIGGEALSKNREHMRAIGGRGGQAVAAIPGHMAELGRLSAKYRRAKKLAEQGESFEKITS